MYWLRTLWAELYDAISAIVNVISLWLLGETSDFDGDTDSDSSFTYNRPSQYPYHHPSPSGLSSTDPSVRAEPMLTLEEQYQAWRGGRKS